MSPASQEARRFLFPLHLTNALLFVTWWLWPWTWPEVLGLFTLFILLALFIGYFFRDPERTVPSDPNLIVSAADGLVTGVDEMDEPDFRLGRMRRIAVFLSVFDVHVNRAPFEARVTKTAYKPGKFLDARHPDASTGNECLAWRLESSRGPVAIRQIAGLIARRIVAWSGEGKAVARGERIGMIRFGSRTEVFVPLECAILVKPGDRVKGAATPIARWP
ncbi:MAG TPA: phosphatidylserine decarboxylase [Candidatus Methylacidiphilales bacterium]|nr:phosphatidylserine decarboxylase [Candidatus Methylacidiphilales bacterium]